MNQNSNNESPPLPGIIETLVAGFELATSHLWLLAFPIILDLFYWLGPRLRITELVAELVEVSSGEPEIADLVDILIELGPRVNLFSYLSVPVIGIPALMGGSSPEETPIATTNYEIGGVFSWFVIALALGLVGIGLAALYLYLIGQVVNAASEVGIPTLAVSLRALLIAFMRLLGFVIGFLIAMLLIAIPLLPVAFLLSNINSLFAASVMLMAFIVVAVYFSLAIPGIVMNRRPIFRAIKESIMLVIRNQLPTMILLALVFIIYIGTYLLWSSPDDGSWFTLVGILGHAFIATSLACAFFVYYRDRYSFFINTELKVAE